MDIRDLQKERAKVIASAGAILDAAEKSGDLSAKDRERFDALEEQAKNLDGRIQRQAVLDKRQEEIARNSPIPPWDPNYGQSEGKKRNGSLALNPEERVFDYVRETRGFGLPDGIKPDELDLGRLVKGAATGNWKNSQAELRVMASNPGSAGGYLIPTPLATQLIDLSRNKMVMIQAGARTIPMESATLKLARQSADPTAVWLAENASLTYGDAEFESLKLDAKKLVCGTKCSIELIEDATNLSEVIEDSLSSSVALAFDSKCLYGIGAGGGSGYEPMGIKNVSGIENVNLTASTPEHIERDDFITAITALRTNNCHTPDEKLAAIMAPRTAGYLSKMKNGEGDYLTGPESYDKLKKLVSTQISITQTYDGVSTCSDCFIGDFSQALIGVRTEPTLEVTRSGGDTTNSAFSNVQCWLRVYMRADLVLAHEDHFCVIQGITSS